ncbi:hypothetical protein H5410_062314 [Solanum commersonii]|uniref:Uncharacterized protein n=1 Tax=Solanum commersonii TaxID=4109 RepID=A0A9J5WB88_SOLCO|nr:hypothetical protein H5410_062314 [Solanum commersonii]
MVFMTWKNLRQISMGVLWRHLEAKDVPTSYIVWGEALASQELTCSKDRSSGNEDIEMDVWAYYKAMIWNEVTRDKVRVTGRQDAVGKTEMVQTYEELMKPTSLVMKYFEVYQRGKPPIKAKHMNTQLMDESLFRGAYTVPKDFRQQMHSEKKDMLLNQRIHSETSTDISL